MTENPEPETLTSVFPCAVPNIGCTDIISEGIMYVKTTLSDTTKNPSNDKPNATGPGEVATGATHSRVSESTTRAGLVSNPKEHSTLSTVINDRPITRAIVPPVALPCVG